MRLAGAALVVLGLLALALGGVPYRHTESVARLGGMRFEVSERRRIEIPPLAGGIVVLVGAAMLFSRGRRPRP